MSNEKNASQADNFHMPENAAQEQNVLSALTRQPTSSASQQTPAEVISSTTQIGTLAPIDNSEFNPSMHDMPFASAQETQLHQTPSDNSTQTRTIGEVYFISNQQDDETQIIDRDAQPPAKPTDDLSNSAVPIVDQDSEFHQGGPISSPNSQPTTKMQLPNMPANLPSRSLYPVYTGALLAVSGLAINVHNGSGASFGHPLLYAGVAYILVAGLVAMASASWKAHIETYKSLYLDPPIPYEHQRTIDIVNQLNDINSDMNPDPRNGKLRLFSASMLACAALYAIGAGVSSLASGASAGEAMNPKHFSHVGGILIITFVTVAIATAFCAAALEARQIKKIQRLVNAEIEEDAQKKENSNEPATDFHIEEDAQIKAESDESATDSHVEEDSNVLEPDSIPEAVPQTISVSKYKYAQCFFNPRGTATAGALTLTVGAYGIRNTATMLTGASLMVLGLLLSAWSEAHKACTNRKVNTVHKGGSIAAAAGATGAAVTSGLMLSQGTMPTHLLSADMLGLLIATGVMTLGAIVTFVSDKESSSKVLNNLRAAASGENHQELRAER